MLRAEASRLVSVTRMDRIGLFGLQQYLARGLVRNRDRVLSEREKKGYDCVANADSSVYVGPLAEELAKELSLEELRQAMGFFESGAGRKLVESDLDVLARAFSGQAVELPRLSVQERRDLDQFRRTPVGKKLLVDGILNLDPIADTLARTSDELGRACARST